MTLVVAVGSHEGVVLASDGQSTAECAGQPTKRRAVKLADHGGMIAWGWAGSAGLQQTVHPLLDDLDLDTSSEGLRVQVVERVVAAQQLAMKQYMPFSGTEPPDLSCLFCWWDGGPRILEIPRTGGDHQFCYGHAAIGSGDVFAQFALGTLPVDPHALNLDEAKLVAYAAVADTIKVAAFFVGPPIQMRTVTAAGVSVLAHDELHHLLPAQVERLRARERAALAKTAAAQRRQRAA